MNDDSFFSMDRLVEFGLSMAVAQQMTNTMNHCMQNMHVPGAMQPMQQTFSTQPIFIAVNGNSIGPLSHSEFMTLVNNGSVNKDSLAWMAGMPSWKRIEDIPEILKLIALTPPPLTP